MSTVLIIWANFGNSWRDPNYFLPGAIGDHGRNLIISLWTGDKATIKEVAAWWLTPPQKIPSVKIRWKSSRLDFLGSRRHPPQWLSSKLQNYQGGVLVISAGATEGHFEGKTPLGGKVTNGGLVLARQCSGSPDTCNTEETGLPGLPVSWSPTIVSRSGPVGLPPVPRTEKTIECSPFFVRRGGHCCPGDLVGGTNFWIFFEWLAKVTATGEWVYWASWGVCWINSELVAVACFLPGLAKDFSAPPRTEATYNQAVDI